MVDGPTKATDLDKTEYNREIVRSFVEDILINSKFNRLKDYIDDEYFTEHNPRICDGLSALYSALSDPVSNDGISIKYEKIHRILAEGNFVLSVSEGSLNGVHSSFYDLYRVAHDRLVEHWDTTEAITPRHKWKNDNGKF
jgi:predicted SnoaL-like aldol condensation-catalyzing enzyme